MTGLCEIKTIIIIFIITFIIIIAITLLRNNE